MTVVPELSLTAEAYLAHERNARTKSEFRDGVLHPMPGANRNHTLLVSTIIGLLFAALPEEFEIYASDMRVRITGTQNYLYPDIVLAREPVQYDDDYVDVLLNPVVIFEVLSPSTEAYDRGEKFSLYQKIPSLREYILVTQTAQRIEQFVRLDKDSWNYRELSIGGAIDFPALGCKLPLAEIYSRVTFGGKE